MRILCTGATGFIGTNVLPFLQEKYDVHYYARSQLNLLDFFQVAEVFKDDYDVVLHLANPNHVKNGMDSKSSQCEDSIRMFQNLYFFREKYKKMIYIGSGAEYDKSKDIVNISEDEWGRSIPVDSYGLAKYTINQIAASGKNIYNLCVFGCFGPFDYYTKFITHCIRSILLNKDITIRKDCFFDYIHVYDLAKMIMWVIDNNVQFNRYNASGGEHLKLSDIAAIVLKQMHSTRKIKIIEPGMANTYTASNVRIISESRLPLLSIAEGIEMQINWEKEHWSINTKFDGV